MAKKKSKKSSKSNKCDDCESCGKYQWLLVFAVAVVVVIILMMLIRGVRNAPDTPDMPYDLQVEEPVEPVISVPVEKETSVEPSKTLPETEKGESYVGRSDLSSGEYSHSGVVGNPQYQDDEFATDLSAEPERFSNFKCYEEDGIWYLSLKVTNTNEEEHFFISHAGVQKGYNTYFLLRGLVDDNPSCTVDELSPGESTICEKVGLDNPRFGLMDGTNRLTIQSPADGGRKTTEAVVVNCK